MRRKLSADIHVAAPLLRVLDLSRNNFTSMPTQVWELQCLEYLNLAGNQMAAIDKDVRGDRGQLLLRCVSVDLSENLFTSIPASLLQRLPALTHLDMGGNEPPSGPSAFVSTALALTFCCTRQSPRQPLAHGRLAQAASCPRLSLSRPCHLTSESRRRRSGAARGRCVGKRAGGAARAWRRARRCSSWRR